MKGDITVLVCALLSWAGVASYLVYLHMKIHALEKKNG